MKKIYLFGFLICFSALNSICKGQDYYSYYKNEKKKYSLSLDKILFIVNEDVDKNTLNLKDLEIEKIDILGNGIALRANIKHQDTQAQLLALVEKFNSYKEIKYASPILKNSDNQEFGALRDQFMVRLKDKGTISSFESLLSKFDAKNEKYEFDSLTYFVRPNDPKVNTLFLANTFYESGLFEYSEPDFWLFINPASSEQTRSMPCQVDQYYSQQWALQNTGQNGGTVDADMDVNDAWVRTTGSNSVRIAILDNGVQTSHPELSPNLLAGYNATTQTTDPNPTANQTNLQHDFHGTAVAGIAAAKGCDGVGVTGVAYTSKMVPVKLYSGEQDPLASASWVSGAIDWASSQNRSDILLMPFRFGGAQSAIDISINSAVTQGRNNLGCLLLAASYNDGISGIAYPSSNSQVVAVGNSDKTDHWAGSNYGTGLDIVAPGVGIYTTDLTDFYGQQNILGDYNSNFSGTSASVPNAGGSAALILSRNTNMTGAQLRLLLESTTEKVGGYSYGAGVSGQPSGSWHNQMGYGRVNANRGVIAADPDNILGPDVICTTGNYSLQIEPNVTRTWTSNNPSVLTINSSTGVATRNGSASGFVNLTMTYSNGTTSYSINRTVYVGVPSALSLLYVPNKSPDNQLCRNTDTAITLTNSNQTSQGVTQYNWSAGSWSSYLITYPGSPIPTTYALFNVPSSGPTSQSISVTAQNACGVSSPITKIFVTVACGGPISRMAYPNPASDILTVGFEKSNNKLPEQILLYSEESQKAVYSITYEELAIALSKAMTLDIPVKEYPRGTYYLHIVKDDGDVDKTKVILE